MFNLELPKQTSCISPIVESINQVIETHRRWGFWKCFSRLRNQGYAWNHKRVYRVYCQLKLNLVRRTKKRVPKRVIHPLNEAQQPNQVWAIDFMHERVASRPFRTFNVIDEANRKALALTLVVHAERAGDTLSQSTRGDSWQTASATL